MLALILSVLRFVQTMVGVGGGTLLNSEREGCPKRLVTGIGIGYRQNQMTHEFDDFP